MNSEDTILNQQQNDNEETLPNNDQSTAKEQPAKKDSSWKHVTTVSYTHLTLPTIA